MLHDIRCSSVDKPSQIHSVLNVSDTVQLAEAPRWDSVAWVVEHNTRDLLDKKFSLNSEIASWFKSLKLFREAETERLILREPTTNDLRWHKALLAALLADGERLLLEWNATDAQAENPDRIRPTDLQAAVEGLYATQSSWHGGMTDAQRDEILRAVFDVAPAEISFTPPPVGDGA